MTKIQRYGWEAMLVVLIIAAGAWATSLSPYYLQVDQLLSSSQQFFIFGIMALGLVPIVVQGEIDISLTSTLAVGTVTLGQLAHAGVPAVLGIVIALLVCAVLGSVNGILVAYAKLPSLAVTLGTLGAYSGVAYIIGGNTGITGFPDSYTLLGASYAGPVPMGLILFVLLAVVMAVALGAGSFGRYSYAIGNNVEASRMAGVRVPLAKLGSYVIAAVFAGIGSLLWVGQYASARGDNGDGQILFVLTAVVLGGVSIKGGSGTVVGVVLSVLLLGTLANGMGLANFPGTTQTLVLGALLVGSLAVPRTIRLVGERRRRSRPAPADTPSLDPASA
jgi:rhamnose transport system permease protein